jgi:hypothetical protein
MPPAVAPIPPGALKTILEMYGFVVIAEDGFNWVLEDPKQADSEPIVIPKIGELVAVEVMMQALIDSKLPFSAYLALKEKVLGKDWVYTSLAGKNPGKKN